MGKYVDVLFRDYKIVRVWRLSKKMFPNYMIDAKTDDAEGKEISLSKVVEFLNGKNAFFCSNHFEMDEPEKFLKHFSWQGKFPGTHYLQPYKTDEETLRILAKHAKDIFVKFFPEDFDWERARTEYDKTLEKRTAVNDISFSGNYSYFSFQITPESKGFGEDYLNQLEKCGYRIKYY